MDAGYRITLDNALIGVGPYAGQAMVPRYAPEFADLPAKGLHNLFFEISTGCGVPATILYFSYFLIPWFVLSRYYLLNRYDVSPEIGTLCLTLAIAVPGYFVSSMFSSGALLESFLCDSKHVCWRLLGLDAKRSNVNDAELNPQDEAEPEEDEMDDLY